MSHVTAIERTLVARLAGAGRRRRWRARLKRALLLAPRHVPVRADELRFVPPDIGTPDPSFLDELKSGEMGLGGTVVCFGADSPFAVPAPTLAWAHAAHGFAWLRHLRAAPDVEAAPLARRLAADWISRQSRLRDDEAFALPALATRVVAWLQNAHFLLEGAPADFYIALTRSLGRQVRALDLANDEAPPGPDRLRAAAASVLASLVLAGQETHRPRLEKRLGARLAEEILPEGAHVSRNPDTALALLLDLLPLAHSYAGADGKPPAALADAIRRMIGHLKHVRRGDGELARFNGMGATHLDVLATVLAYDAGPVDAAPAAHASYRRLAAGDMVVLVDAGGPPPIEHSGRAHAGCLSFELSHGPTAILVNGGVPEAGQRQVAARARATASHNALVLDDRSSAHLVVSPVIERLLGGAALRGPANVRADPIDDPATPGLQLSHDGWAEDLGLVHHRRLAVGADGRTFAGVDRLTQAPGKGAAGPHIPFAIHFHLARGCVCPPATAEPHLTFTAPDLSRWRLEAAGARLSVEDSTDFTAPASRSRRRQVVLRGTATDGTEIAWSFRRL